MALGHANNDRVRHLNPTIGKAVDVVDKSEFQEFQADMWACRSLIELARVRRRSDSDLSLAVGGISLAIGTGLLVEASAAKNRIPLPLGHPPAKDRLYMLEVAFEFFGAHTEAYIGRRFRELLQGVIATAYPAAELAPMLARDLNRKLVPVQ